MKIKLGLILIVEFLILNSKAFSQDPNFHIYLCFGQSNMEGAAKAELQDSTVDARFQVLEAVDCTNLGRIKGNWYPAVPPLCRCRTNLGPITCISALPVTVNWAKGMRKKCFHF